MKFILVCDCGSTSFSYSERELCFTCQDCGDIYTEEEAGHELLGEGTNEE